MLGDSLERLGGLFDRPFLLAYWSPIFLGFAAVGALIVFVKGLGTLSTAWLQLSGVEQVLLGAGAFLCITVVAYCFSAFTRPLIRLYEGYWPRFLGWLQRTRIGKYQSRHRALIRQMHDMRYLGIGLPADRVLDWMKVYDNYAMHYPRDPEKVKATRLGNILVAAEEYSALRYQMDAVIWWPRLLAVVPETVRYQVDEALTPMVALLNLATVSGLAAVGAALWLWVWQAQALGALVALGSGVLASVLLYGIATMLALPYAQMIRTVFDLYRFALLEQMRIPLPASAQEERRLWPALTQWLYYGDLGRWSPVYVHFHGEQRTPSNGQIPAQTPVLDAVRARPQSKEPKK